MLTVDFSAIDVHETDPWDVYTEAERDYMSQHVPASWDIPVSIDDLFLTLDGFETVGQNASGASVYVREACSTEVSDMIVYGDLGDTMLGIATDHEIDYIVMILPGNSSVHKVAIDPENMAAMVVDSQYTPRAYIHGPRHNA